MTLVDQMSASYIQKHTYSSLSFAMQTESSRISDAKRKTEHASANAVTACASRTFILRLIVDHIAAVAATVAMKAAASTSFGTDGPFLTRCSRRSFKKVPRGRKHVTNSEICAMVRAMNRTKARDFVEPFALSEILRRKVFVGEYSEPSSFVQRANESTCQTVSGNSSNNEGDSLDPECSDIRATVTWGRKESVSKNSNPSQNALLAAATAALLSADNSSGRSVVTTSAVLQKASVPVKLRSNSPRAIRDSSFVRF